MCRISKPSPTLVATISVTPTSTTLSTALALYAPTPSHLTSMQCTCRAIVVAAMLLGSQAGIAAAVCLALALVDYTFSFLREGWELEVFTSPPSWVTTALTAYCAMCAVTAPDAVAPALVAVLQVTLSKMVAECSLCMRAVGQSPFRPYMQ